MRFRDHRANRLQPPRQAAATLGLALAVATSLAAVHEEGVLKLASRALVAGDSLPVKGEKFTKRSPLTLALAGMAGRLSLGTLQTDSTGALTAIVLVPRDAAAGSYRLVAIAEDGDEVASLDVTVSAAAATDHAAMPSHEGMEMDEPSSEPLALDRARSPLVTWSVVTGIGLAVVGGVVLLRRPGSGGPLTRMR